MTVSVCHVCLVKHLGLCLVWSGALYSHTFLYNHVCCSSAQLSSWHLTAWHKVCPLFSKEDIGEEQHFSVTFIPLSSSFTLSTAHHVLPLPAFPSSVLLPGSPTHHLLSLSPNDLIPPMPLHLNSGVWSDFSVEVTRRVWMWQRWFLLVSTWAGYLRCYVTLGNCLFSECTMQGKYCNSHSSGFHDAF